MGRRLRHMTSTAKKWASRVAEWKSSGQTSPAFCQGKPFTAGGLRHWAARLRVQGRPQEGAPTIRISRVVRVPAPLRLESEERLPSVTSRPVQVPSPTALVVEIGAARVTVPSGFDPEMLAAVLEVIPPRGGR